jgi:hypothetical protein
MERQSTLFPVLKIHRARRALLLVMAGVFILATSCISTQKAGPVPQKAAPMAAPPKPLAPVPILAQRIQALERCLEEKGMAEADEKTAREILNTYRALQAASSKALTSEDRERLIQKLFHSLMLVEERFFKGSVGGPNHPSPPKTTLYIREVQFPRPEKENQADARTVVRTGPPLPIESQEAEAPPKPAEVKDQRDVPEDRAEAAVDVNLLLQEVNDLIQSGKYEEATRLLVKAEAKTVAGPAKEIILRAKEQIDAERKIPRISDDVNGGDTRKIEAETKDLLEQEKFEEAISQLKNVEGASPTPHEKELARLKERAETGLINRERNRAAKIFLKAKRTSDPDLKREELSMSRDILAELILNYPNSSLIPTLEQNLQVVVESLQVLTDPH